MKFNTRIFVAVAILIFILSAGCSDQNPDQTPTVSTQQTLVTEYHGIHSEIIVNEVIRGSEANSIVEKGSMINPDPDSESEYIMYNVQIKNSGDKSLSILPLIGFPVYADNEKSDVTTVLLSRDYQVFGPTIDLLPGEETSGWIVRQVPIGSNVKMAYEPFTEDIIGYVQF